MESLNDSFVKTMIDDEFDHSFVSVESSSQARVRWKNKAGEIQFCGSGAFGLLWFLYEKSDAEKIGLSSPFVELDSKKTANEIQLKFPGAVPESLNDRLFRDSHSGIYFLQVDCLEELAGPDVFNSHRGDLPSAGVHGFCMFHWSVTDNKGYLRYFCPWHGRDEDSVTGSIHKYLTPLVFSLYGAESMTWQQLSSSPGIIHTSYQRGWVSLQGVCSIE